MTGGRIETGVDHLLLLRPTCGQNFKSFTLVDLEILGEGGSWPLPRCFAYRKNRKMLEGLKDKKRFHMQMKIP